MFSPSRYEVSSYGITWGFNYFPWFFLNGHLRFYSQDS